MAVRNIHLYGIVAPFVLAETLTEFRNIRLVERLEITLRNVEDRITGIFWPVVAAIFLSIFAITNGTMQKFYQFSPPMFPVRAVEWLEKNPQQGKMFNNLNWGGYLALHLWPEQLTFIDSMSDVTGDVTMQYETVITLADGWQNIFEQYNINWAIIERDSVLARELEFRQQWHVLYQDNNSVILRR
jgi:hypothetical protein